jgi:hypothetical protein
LKPLIEEALLLSWLVRVWGGRFGVSVGEPGTNYQRPIAAKQGRLDLNGKWAKLMPMSAFWLIYGIAAATEAPSQAVAVLQYSLLACALFGPVGSPNMRGRNEPRQRAARPVQRSRKV